MKRRLFLMIACVFLAFLLCFCASSSNQQTMSKESSVQIKFSKEFMELLDNVNEEHKKIEKPAINKKAIIEKYDNNPSKYSFEPQNTDDVAQGNMLTAAQAKNDTNQLFYNLQTKYGLYMYYGGDQVFETARNAILSECEKAENLTTDLFRNILLKNLSFIDDQHFSLDWFRPKGKILPYYYTEEAFEKTETGYQTAKDKKKVAYVEGYDDLSSLFHRSISPDGDIVYYPVNFSERMIMYGQEYNNSITDSITVHYEDGTLQVLLANPYHSGYNKTGTVVKQYENQGIPVLFSNQIPSVNSEDGKAMLEYADKQKDKPVIIVDLRSNIGGYGGLPGKWLESYLGKIVPSNFYWIRYGTPIMITDRRINDNLGLAFEQPDSYIENDNLIIVLTGKDTYSAAEIFVDLLHNVNNVLVIGDLTGGCILGDMIYGYGVDGYRLTNNNIQMYFGGSLHIFPDEEYFMEGRGFKPDLWVSGADAEELAIKLIKKNIVK